MCKLLTAVYNLLMWIYNIRLVKAWKKVESLLESGASAEQLRAAFTINTEDVSDSMLDAMISNFDTIMITSKDVARINEKLKAVGIDFLQELKNEKFLREHRKKHEDVS